jgi:hypothetical protein
MTTMGVIFRCDNVNSDTSPNRVVTPRWTDYRPSVAKWFPLGLMASTDRKIIFMDPDYRP